MSSLLPFITKLGWPIFLSFAKDELLTVQDLLIWLTSFYGYLFCVLLIFSRQECGFYLSEWAKVLWKVVDVMWFGAVSCTSFHCFGQRSAGLVTSLENQFFMLLSSDLKSQIRFFCVAMSVSRNCPCLEFEGNQFLLNSQEEVIMGFVGFDHRILYSICYMLQLYWPPHAQFLLVLTFVKNVAIFLSQLFLILILYLQKMDSHLTVKKKIEKKDNSKRPVSAPNISKPNKKKILKQSASAASLPKNAMTGSTFHTIVPRSLPKKSTSKKLIKNKKGDKGKQNNASRTKPKHKHTKLKKEKIQELTDRNKIHLEFFMYKNTYLPIENTEQRKMVYKIHLIDERLTYSGKSHRAMVDQVTATEEVEKKNVSTEPPPFNSQQIAKTDSQIQTQFQNRLSQSESCYSEQSQKCFVSTLSELEFLYLPDEKNFDGFSMSEKVHYRDLFLFMAKKFQAQKEDLDETKIQAMLIERQSMQRGLGEVSLKSGIPTHTPSILSYLANLFFYIEIHDKGSLVDRINWSYGYTVLERLARIRHGLPTDQKRKLISQTTFWSFEEQLHGDMNFESGLVEESLHYHNKAIFDCVNQYLEHFQPYYSSCGEPFPWNYNFQTTFYCITEDSFNALGCQIKEKVWESCTTLAGLILNVDSEQKYKTHIHKILQNQRAMIMKEARKTNFIVETQQARTRVMMDVGQQIVDELVLQISQFLLLR